jgi:hypothetical protein
MNRNFADGLLIHFRTPGGPAAGRDEPALLQPLGGDPRARVLVRDPFKMMSGTRLTAAR